MLFLFSCYPGPPISGNEDQGKMCASYYGGVGDNRIGLSERIIKIAFLQHTMEIRLGRQGEMW